MDWVSDKIYWTDAVLQVIEVFDLINVNRTTLISTGKLSRPKAIVLDPSTR